MSTSTKRRSCKKPPTARRKKPRAKKPTTGKAPALSKPGVSTVGGVVVRSEKPAVAEDLMQQATSVGDDGKQRVSLLELLRLRGRQRRRTGAASLAAVSASKYRAVECRRCGCPNPIFLRRWVEGYAARGEGFKVTCEHCGRTFRTGPPPT